MHDFLCWAASVMVLMIFSLPETHVLVETFPLECGLTYGLALTENDTKNQRSSLRLCNREAESFLDHSF